MRGLDRALIRTLTTLVALIALPATAVEAQIGSPVPPGAPEAPAAPDAQECVCVRGMPAMGQMRSVAPARVAFSMGRRARLGVMLGEPATVAGRQGIRLEEVPEGTPAQRAGLREGDVIVGLNGDDLGDRPRLRLNELMSDVEPGDTVAVTFFRSGREQTAQVATEESSRFRAFAPGHGWREGGPGPDVEIFRTMRAPEGGRTHVLHRGLLQLSRQGGLELAAVNPELGQYFGTERGVLVTSAGADSPLGLRSGDVILDIGGREVQDPAHVRAILASYRGGEDIALRIVREKRIREITGRHD